MVFGSEPEPAAAFRFRLIRLGFIPPRTYSPRRTNREFNASTVFRLFGGQIPKGTVIIDTVNIHSTKFPPTAGHYSIWRRGMIPPLFHTVHASLFCLLLRFTEKNPRIRDAASLAFRQSKDRVHVNFANLRNFLGQP